MHKKYLILPLMVVTLHAAEGLLPAAALCLRPESDIFNDLDFSKRPNLNRRDTDQQAEFVFEELGSSEKVSSGFSKPPLDKVTSFNLSQFASQFQHNFSFSGAGGAVNSTASNPIALAVPPKIDLKQKIDIFKSFLSGHFKRMVEQMPFEFYDTTSSDHVVNVLSAHAKAISSDRQQIAYCASTIAQLRWQWLRYNGIDTLEDQFIVQAESGCLLVFPPAVAVSSVPDSNNEVTESKKSQSVTKIEARKYVAYQVQAKIKERKNKLLDDAWASYKGTGSYSQITFRETLEKIIDGKQKFVGDFKKHCQNNLSTEIFKKIQQECRTSKNRVYKQNSRIRKGDKR